MCLLISKILEPKSPIDNGTEDAPIHLQSEQLRQAKQIYSEQVEGRQSAQLEMERIDNYDPKRKLFFPGKSKGQPYKRDYYSYCYSITKVAGKQRTNAGDPFDNFISQADK